MANSIKHVEVNVKNLKASKAFYQKLLTYFRWRKILEEKDIMGWSNGREDIFLVQTEKKYQRPPFHRKRVGLNHLCFSAKSKMEVNKFVKEFLFKNKIPLLYGGPKEWPEYRGGYYAVYFEDPDRIKLEFAYIPK